MCYGNATLFCQENNIEPESKKGLILCSSRPVKLEIYCTFTLIGYVLFQSEFQLLNISSSVFLHMFEIPFFPNSWNFITMLYLRTLSLTLS